METAAAILTQLVFENESYALTLRQAGGLIGDPSGIGEKIRPVYAAMLKLVDEETRLRR